MRIIPFNGPQGKAGCGQIPSHRQPDGNGSPVKREQREWQHHES